MFFIKKEKDPVCGMEVKVKSSTLQLNYHGKVYYFCSADCRSSFESNPERFQSSNSKSSSSTDRRWEK